MRLAGGAVQWRWPGQWLGESLPSPQLRWYQSAAAANSSSVRRGARRWELAVSREAPRRPAPAGAWRTPLPAAPRRRHPSRSARELAVRRRPEGLRGHIPVHQHLRFVRSKRSPSRVNHPISHYAVPGRDTASARLVDRLPGIAAAVLRHSGNVGRSAPCSRASCSASPTGTSVAPIPWTRSITTYGASISGGCRRTPPPRGPHTGRPRNGDHAASFRRSPSNPGRATRSNKASPSPNPVRDTACVTNTCSG